MNKRLASTLFAIISTPPMGIAVVVALVTGNDTLQPILIAAGIGFVIGFPVTYVVTKMVADL
jgi:hypothetical protein